MYNPDDNIVELRKYIKKLVFIIEYESKFTFFKKKIVDKARIDDILCCIESCFPDEYKKWVKQHGSNSLPSYKMYKQLAMSIRNKTIFGASNYAVHHVEAKQIMTKLAAAFYSDLCMILNHE